MNAQHMMVGAALLILTGCQTMAHEAMPTLTRTGQVKDILIQEDVSPVTVTVNPGDEIRWINKRQGPARVIFLDPVMDMLSCERNFGGFGRTDRHQYTANLSTNDSASVCFSNGGQIKYVIRADSAVVPSGEMNVPGTIQVAGGGTEERGMAEDTTKTREGIASRTEERETAEDTTKTREGISSKPSSR